ncbi:MAG: hypothetical protein ACI8UC_001235, partial [Psychromonas sp.]
FVANVYKPNLYWLVIACAITGDLLISSAQFEPDTFVCS